nr:alanine and glycine-rich protein-like [Taeniopygia guttata]
MGAVVGAVGAVVGAVGAVVGAVGAATPQPPHFTRGPRAAAAKWRRHHVPAARGLARRLRWGGGGGSALGVSRARRAERGAGPALLALLCPCSAPPPGLTLRGSRAPAAVSGGAAAGTGLCAAAGGGGEDRPGRGGSPGCGDCLTV